MTSDEGALRLRSFVWPGQPGRMERLDLAIEVVRREPPQLRRSDLVEALLGLLAARAPNALTIVFHGAWLEWLG